MRVETLCMCFHRLPCASLSWSNVFDCAECRGVIFAQIYLPRQPRVRDTSRHANAKLDCLLVWFVGTCLCAVDAHRQ